MNLSPHNTVAVGDAENDLSLFGIAEIGVAVANAVPSVREHADLVLDKNNGAGVADLLAGPYPQRGATLVSAALAGDQFAPSTTDCSVKVPGSQVDVRLPGLPGQARVTWSGSWRSDGFQAGRLCASP